MDADRTTQSALFAGHVVVRSDRNRAKLYQPLGQPLREELHLEPGDSLEMESAGEQITGPLTKEHSVWVFKSGQPLPASATDEMLQAIREERDLGNLGRGR